MSDPWETTLPYREADNLPTPGATAGSAVAAAALQYHSDGAVV
jgi:hypothetical protein